MVAALTTAGPARAEGIVPAARVSSPTASRPLWRCAIDWTNFVLHGDSGVREFVARHGWAELERRLAAASDLSAAWGERRLAYRDGHWLIKMRETFRGEELRAIVGTRGPRGSRRPVRTSYLTASEREAFRVQAFRGYLTTAGFRRFLGDRAGFVVDGRGRLYLFNSIATEPHEARMGYHLHHSSFTDGGPVRSAGELHFDGTGDLTTVTPHSGHYRPPFEVFRQVVPVLRDLGVDLRRARLSGPEGAPPLPAHLADPGNF